MKCITRKCFKASAFLFPTIIFLSALSGCKARDLAEDSTLQQSARTDGALDALMRQLSDPNNVIENPDRITFLEKDSRLTPEFKKLLRDWNQKLCDSRNRVVVAYENLNYSNKAGKALSKDWDRSCLPASKSVTNAVFKGAFDAEVLPLNQPSEPAKQLSQLSGQVLNLFNNRSPVICPLASSTKQPFRAFFDYVLKTEGYTLNLMVIEPCRF